MIGVRVIYRLSFMDSDQHYQAQLINVSHVGGEWKAVIYVDGELQVIPADSLMEWSGPRG